MIDISLECCHTEFMKRKRENDKVAYTLLNFIFGLILTGLASVLVIFKLENDVHRTKWLLARP